jgi:ABC-type cobalamin/Fe3+-siderophores transport system ATPase subunit
LKIDKLQIEGFKNLRNFEIDFDEQSNVPHSVLVGPNGAGKSNLLEALLSIFSRLALDATAPFAYTLRYICDGHYVVITAVTTGQHPKFEVDGAPIARSHFMKKGAAGTSQYLPRFVFGYYSGASDRFHEYFTEHQRIFYRKLKARNADPNMLPFRPLFLAKPSHGQFVLLAFYSHEDAPVRAFLKSHLGILDLESVLFVIKRPGWQKKRTDDRFWDATGIPRVFLEEVFRYAIGPIRQARQREIDFRERPKTIDCWNLFLDRDGFERLAKTYARPQDLFKTLESTEISDLLLEVRVKVKVQNVDGSISFRELSEGEQQLLLVLGLLRFTKEEESLFLLDEPDTHLNPAWSVQYLKLIGDIVGAQPSSHIVMATHDPLVFAGLTMKEVRVMKLDRETGNIVAKPPEEDPRGMGVEAILTSDLFGLRSALDLPTMNKLDAKRHLQSLDNPTLQQRTELDQITEDLQGLPFSMSTADPLYPLFVREMMKAQEREQLLVPVLTPEQQHRQREIAAEIVQRLREHDVSGEV